LAATFEIVPQLLALLIEAGRSVVAHGVAIVTTACCEDGLGEAMIAPARSTTPVKPRATRFTIVPNHYT
jgi:hypothetical protein